MENKNLGFKQLFEKESSTYTYLLWDKKTKDAIIIDPVKETFERDSKIVEELNLNLLYVLETHIHADHITSSYSLKNRFDSKIVLGKGSNLKKADILLADNKEISFGNFTLKAIATPGHTNGCTSYLIENLLFSGDTLLIHSVGRCDFQEGDATKLYESVNKLYSLGNEIIVYPAHNYDGISNSSIREERRLNKFINDDLSKEESIKLINNRKDS